MFSDDFIPFAGFRRGRQGPESQNQNNHLRIKYTKVTQIHVRTGFNSENNLCLHTTAQPFKCLLSLKNIRLSKEGFLCAEITFRGKEAVQSKNWQSSFELKFNTYDQV